MGQSHIIGTSEKQSKNKFKQRAIAPQIQKTMTKVDNFRKVADALCHLYEAKNKAYGDSFGSTFQKLGIISSVTRISDKYNRLCNLATNPDIDNLGESIEDTLKDLASYAIMTLIELDNKKIVGINVNDNSFVFKGDTISPYSNDIKVGDKFLCIKSVIDNEEQMPYKIGEIYTSEIDGCITNEMGYKDHKWKNVPYFNEYFKRIN